MTATARDHDEAVSSFDVPGRGAPALRDDADARLDAAGELIADDPGRAETELDACRAWFARHGPAVSEHRATYLLAQSLVAQGRLEEAIPLIDAARDGFDSCGERVLALRTNLGRSHVLVELRRLDDAIAANEDLIAGLDALTSAGLSISAAEHLYSGAHQNIGIYRFHAGHMADALASFDRASAFIVGIDDDEIRSALVLNRARTLMALGRVDEAIADLEHWTTSIEHAPPRADLADTMVKLAEAQILTGDYAAALATVRRADEILRSIDAPFHRHEHSMIAGQAYLALNLYQESIDAFREAQKWLRDAGLDAIEALATWGVGLALSGLAHYREARNEFGAAAELFRSTGQSMWLARTLLEQARVLDRLGEHKVALDNAREALTLATDTSALIEVVRAQLVCADLGDQPEARRRASLGVARQLRLIPVLLSSIHASGRQALAAGDVPGARAMLGEAVELIELQRSRLRHETLLGSFAHDKRAVYSDLVKSHLEGDDADVARAAQIADGSKSRSLLDLAHGASRGRVGGGAEGLAEERSALERDLHAAYHELFAATADDVDRFVALSARANELERQVSRLRLTELDSNGPSDTSISIYTPPAVPVVSYVALDDELIAFVADYDGVEVVRSVASMADVDMLVQRLAAQRERSRLDAGFAGRHGARLERTCRSLLGSLYESVVAPVEHLLPATHEVVAPLVVSPFGLLHSVPFHALWDGDRYMLDRFSISIAPSIGVLQSCEARRADRLDRAVIVGVADELAPRAEQEARSVSTSAQNTTLLLGEQASVSSVLGVAAGADLLHLACHGWFRADNPMFSAIRLADRWLLAHEILDSLNLPGSTVVLSACETGRATVNGGEELLGLVRAFIGAGASTLVASLWPADDALTEQLMSCFYRLLPEHGPAEALRRAQQEVSEHATNPNLWAPFVVIGAR